MKACEPKPSEVSRWKGYNRRKPDKTYKEYLLESDYSDEFKEFCLQEYFNED